MFLIQLQDALVHAAPSMPSELWVVSLFVLFLLGIAAVIDGFKGIVPDPLMFGGLAFVTGTIGYAVSWDLAADHLRQALLVGLFIYGVNAAWYYKFKQDALGMGDAKWTALSVVCFGVESSFMAWGVGSILATIFLGLFRLFKHRITYITFSPFLFVGLSVVLSWRVFR